MIDYLTAIKLDETTDGQTCFVAWHPELPGCMAQGLTMDEAEKNLTDARELVIEHLYSDGLPIPKPMGKDGHWIVDFSLMWSGI